MAENSPEDWPPDLLLDLSPPSLQNTAAVRPTTTRPSRRRPHKYQKWSDAEDQLLQSIVPQLNEDWKAIASYFPLKAIPSIRKRWDLRFNPRTNKGPWTPAEDKLVLSLKREFNGGYWKTIAKHLPGRPPDAVKARYYAVLRDREKEAAPSPPIENREGQAEESGKEEVPEEELELLAVSAPGPSLPVVPTPADRQGRVKALTDALKSLEEMLERTKREVKLITEELNAEPAR